jgi:hypothetical protein
MLIATLAGLAAVTAFAAASADGIGVVQRSHGSVHIERGGARLPAIAGAELYRGDHILTDTDAYAEIRVRGATPLRIGPNADVAVERFATNEKSAGTSSTPRWLHAIASLFTGFSHYR